VTLSLCPYKTSGGKYSSVPGSSTSVWTPAYTPAIPKSIIFICFFILSDKSILANLRSL